MADDQVPTQGKRIAALEEWRAETDQWGDELQSRVDSLDKALSTVELNDADLYQRVSLLTRQLTELYDHIFGKNVRPADYEQDGEGNVTVVDNAWSDTRISDPNDADKVVQAPLPAEPTTQDRVATLEDKLDRLLIAIGNNK